MPSSALRAVTDRERPLDTLQARSPTERRPNFMVTHDFAGRTVLVTGAASGIGRAVAGAFAAAGGRVALADVAVEAGEAAAADLRRTGAEAAFLRCDVSRSDEVAGLVAGVVRAFGRLDCAVNAAGIEIEASRLVDCEESTFDRVLAVNLRSVFLCLKTRSGRCSRSSPAERS